MRIAKRLLLLIVGTIVLSVISSAVVCSLNLTVNEYSVEIEGIDQDAKIVCIADLHGKTYGQDNKRLISKISDQKPNAILLNGDMINNDATEEDIEQFIKLLDDLLEIAPVYFSVGNHEIEYMNQHGEVLLTQIAETETTVLYDAYAETEIGGNTVRIGGTCGHYRSINWDKQYDYEMLREIGSTGVPAIVMNHMPENIICDPGVWDQWTGDLYLCAHTHGGVIQIPGIGGLFAPTQRWFPEYDKGRYLIGDKLDVIITSGLSGYKGVPRIFNMPEICVVNLVPK